MIFFRPPKPHPRFGEKVTVEIDDRRETGKIYWIYGPEKFYLIGFDDPRYLDGIRFEIVISTKVKLG